MTQKLYSLIKDTKMFLPVAQIHLVAHFIKWLVSQEGIKELDGSTTMVDGKNYSGQLAMSALKMIWDLSMIRPVRATMLAAISFNDLGDVILWLEVNEFVVDLSFHDPKSVPENVRLS